MENVSGHEYEFGRFEKQPTVRNFAAESHLNTVHSQNAIIAGLEAEIARLKADRPSDTGGESKFIELLIEACNASFDCGEWQEDPESDCNEAAFRELVDRSKEKKEAVISAFRAALATPVAAIPAAGSRAAWIAPIQITGRIMTALESICANARAGKEQWPQDAWDTLRLAATPTATVIA